MTSPHLSPASADALLFDLGRVVLDIDFSKALACWAGHAGCTPAELVARFVREESYRHHEVGKIDDAAYFESLRQSLGIKLSDAQMLEGWNAIFAGEMPGIAPLPPGPKSACPSMRSPTPTRRMSNISRKPMPTCSVTSAKYSCLRQSGFGNP